MSVDSDHAGDKKFCISRVYFLIYANTASIQRYSNKQSTVQTSVFGAKFEAMKKGINALRGQRYKLRVKGITISCSSFIMG